MSAVIIGIIIGIILVHIFVNTWYMVYGHESHIS